MLGLLRSPSDSGREIIVFAVRQKSFLFSCLGFGRCERRHCGAAFVMMQAISLRFYSYGLLRLVMIEGLSGLGDLLRVSIGRKGLRRQY